jgi:hypothetical protein
VLVRRTCALTWIAPNISVYKQCSEKPARCIHHRNNNSESAYRTSHVVIELKTTASKSLSDNASCFREESKHRGSLSYVKDLSSFPSCVYAYAKLYWNIGLLLACGISSAECRRSGALSGFLPEERREPLPFYGWLKYKFSLVTNISKTFLN